ncbi:response regulator transcription factor [Bordetella ansorpii]|nr:winged helix-turn-helix domain-containing protein [Bordetella ansorpii]
MATDACGLSEITMKQLSILLMTTDEPYRQRALTAMEQAGVVARECTTPLELFGLLEEVDCHIVVLDLSELGELGYAVITRLRGAADLGIIVTGAQLTLEARLRCLQSGADACLPSPVDERELACVTVALARRLLPTIGAHVEPDLPTDTGRWELRDQDWTLIAPAGVHLSLSANERLIVRALLDLSGRSIGRADLAAQLASEGEAGRTTGARSIDVIISRLRRKAELAGVTLPIRTVYGSGYLFANP